MKIIAKIEFAKRRRRLPRVSLRARFVLAIIAVCVTLLGGTPARAAEVADIPADICVTVPAAANNPAPPPPNAPGAVPSPTTLDDADLGEKLTPARRADLDARDKYRLAQKYFFENQPELSLFVFRKILRDYPDHDLVRAPAFHNYMGDAYFETGARRQALVSYKIALGLMAADPAADKTARAQTCFRAGQIYHRLGNGDWAVACFSRAIELDPAGIPFAWWHRGLTRLFLLRDPAGAGADWEKYLQITTPAQDPQWPRIQQALQLVRSPACDIRRIPPSVSIELFFAQGCALPPKIGGPPAVPSGAPALWDLSPPPVKKPENK